MPFEYVQAQIFPLRSTATPRGVSPGAAHLDGGEQALVALPEELARVVGIDDAVAVDVARGVDDAVAVAIDAARQIRGELGERPPGCRTRG